MRTILIRSDVAVTASEGSEQSDTEANAEATSKQSDTEAEAEARFAAAYTRFVDCLHSMDVPIISLAQGALVHLRKRL